MSAPSPVASDWYDAPRYYDIVFDAGSAAEARFLEAAHRRHAASAGKRALEPACGSGRLVVELARRGWDVTGFDLSAPMLAYARERLESAELRARLLCAEMSDFRLRGRFDLAHCLVSTFKYLLDERSARSHLECVARALTPGGIYVLGFHLSEYGDRSRSRERWVARCGGTTVVCNTQVEPADRRARLEDVRTRLRVSERGRERRTETHWRFRTYDEHEVVRLFRSVPELEHVATYDFGYRIDRPRDWPDDQLDCVFVLKKRSRSARRTASDSRSRG
jgi:SAM-dependent methyltransferase